MSLLGIRHNEMKLSKVFLRQMERIDFATKVYHSKRQQTFLEIAEQISISYRQLQRNFSEFLGMTPKEYERADRFHLAVKSLKVFSPSQASVVSGYSDQSHMIKEFRQISGRTPRQIMLLENISLPQLHNRY